MLRPTVRCGYRALPSNTMATSRWWGGQRVTSWPPIRMRPLVIGSMPAIRRSTVLLPQPDGPRMASSSWWRTCKVRSATATVPSACTRVTSSSRTSAIGPPWPHFVQDPAAARDAGTLDILGAERPRSNG